MKRLRRPGGMTGQTLAVLVIGLGLAGQAVAQSGSVVVNRARENSSQRPPGLSRATASEKLNRANEPMHALSLFTIGMPEPTEWRKNDLLQVLIRETSRISSTQELTTETTNEVSGSVTALPLDALQRFVLNQAQIGEIGFEVDREFEGTGEYTRDDDFTGRLTARVIEVLPNGHLIIEARTYIETDDETATMKLSGICDPDTISPAGTILSTDIFDLRLVKEHEGELRKANTKGFFAKVFEAIFAF